MTKFIFKKRTVIIFPSHVLFRKLPHKDLEANFLPLNLGKHVTCLSPKEYGRHEAARLPSLSHNRWGSFCLIRWVTCFGDIQLAYQKFYYSETLMLERSYLGTWVNRPAELPTDRWAFEGAYWMANQAEPSSDYSSKQHLT